MKILLLNPPTPNGKKFIREGRCTQEIGVWGTLWPPISLATIAAVLEKENHYVRIVDCPAENINVSQLKEKISRFSPHTIIWSTGTPSINSDLALGNSIKKIDSSIITVIFGTHATVLSEEILEKNQDIDLIVRNEPEFTVQALMRDYVKSSNLENLEGITFRDRNGRIHRNISRDFIEPLDQLPFPAWHLLKLSNYRLPLKGEKFLIINPIRGCPYKCTFCTSRIYYGEKIRKRSIKSVVNEIKFAIENFKLREFLMWSDTFILDKKYINGFCSAIQRESLKFSWACNSRCDTVDEIVLKNMVKAGCWMISYGIETGNQNILNNCKKNSRHEDTLLAVKMAKNAGLKVAGHFIFGLPGETQKTMEETANLSRSLDLDFAQYYCAVPFPGTELYNLSKEKGWIKEENWENYRQDKAILSYPNLSATEIQTFRNKSFKEFYLKARTGIKILQMLELKGLKHSVMRLKNFMRWTK